MIKITQFPRLMHQTLFFIPYSLLFSQIQKVSQNSALIPKQKPLSQLAENQIAQLTLKDFSIKVHHYIKSPTLRALEDQTVIQSIECQFLKRLQVTTNPQKIRSYGKIIYSLAKAKARESTLNYQNKFGIMLPFASHQSFTMIVMSISRMGPFSRQFGYIVTKLYTKRKGQFNIREKVQLNYVITKNGFQVDSTLIDEIGLMNLNEIVLMLRAYDQSDLLDDKILKTAERNIISRKNQMNVLDLTDLVRIYLKSAFLSKQMQQLFTQMYELLKRNVDEVTFQKIWESFPQALNAGLLQVKFAKAVIVTMKILRKKDRFPEHRWKIFRKTFQQIQNLQIRTDLQSIS